MPTHLPSAIWTDSLAKGSELLLLIAIVDAVDEDGKTLTSVKSLAAKTRFTPRNVQLLVQKLVGLGELSVKIADGAHGIWCYETKFSVPSAKNSVPSAKTTAYQPLTEETWPGLRALITGFNLPIIYLDDENWWNATSHAVGGINMQVLDKEFGKIEAYLIEHPRKRPQPRGWKRFVRTWLQRAYEYERKYHGRSA